MEGNFYISDKVIDRELKSKYGQAYAYCKEPAAKYGKCVEACQINRALAHNACERERVELRKCVDRHLKAMGKPPMTSKVL